MHEDIINICESANRKRSGSAKFEWSAMTRNKVT